MYRYDTFDHRLVAERIAQFRRQVARRLRGELTEEQFRPLRLMNGLYLQLHAYMLRINVPYGCLSSAQLRKFAQIARRFDRGFGHFTTRQNIQFNWIRLEDTPDILDELASVGINTMQSSGNCVRNITSDPYAGRAHDEIEDPRPWCELIRQWSILHPEFSYLPRKFKIAVTGSPNDRAAVRVHDIGLRMHRNAQGLTGFEVIVGGGLGRTPVIGQTIREWLAPKHLLSYLEAILRVYNLGGRRDNNQKARIKIQVSALGVDAFRELVEQEWAANRDNPLAQLPEAELARIRACFVPPAYTPAGSDRHVLERQRAADREFDRWATACVVEHRVPGHAIVNLSLKDGAHAPGDLTADQMEAVAALADAYSFGELRITHRQNLVFPDVRVDALHELWQQLRPLGLATPNIGQVTDIIACPGLDYCSLANARSIPVAQAIRQHVARLGEETFGELSLNISGCMNACGHHHVGHIGILGVDKAGKEYYQFTLGGSSARDAALGVRLGAGLPAGEVPGAVEKLLHCYRSLREPGERFIDTFRRTGTEPFRNAVYGHRQTDRREVA